MHIQRLLGVFALSLGAGLPLSAGDEVVEVRWNELPRLVQGRTTEASLADGVRITGRVLDVAADALTMQVTQTSNAQAYPKGKASVPKSSIRVLRVTTRRGPWRVLAALGGGGAGILAARQVSFGAGGKSISKTTASHLIIPPALAIAGYLMGRSADRRTTVIKLSAQESSP